MEEWDELPGSEWEERCERLRAFSGGRLSQVDGVVCAAAEREDYAMGRGPRTTMPALFVSRSTFDQPTSRVVEGI